MQPPKMIFSQLWTGFIRRLFRRIVARHRGDYKVQSFSCWDQFLCQSFAQLTYRESLRDIEVCLRSLCRPAYRLGIFARGVAHYAGLRQRAIAWRMYADSGRAAHRQSEARLRLGPTR